MGISKALADENRVRMLLALRGRELCACQLNALFGLAASTMSKHLSLLYQAGLVNTRKEGRWVYYSLPGREAPVAVRKALAWVCESLGETERAIEDARRLRQVLKTDPAQLCKQQCKN